MWKSTYAEVRCFLHNWKLISMGFMHNYLWNSPHFVKISVTIDNCIGVVRMIDACYPSPLWRRTDIGASNFWTFYSNFPVFCLIQLLSGEIWHSLEPLIRDFFTRMKPSTMRLYNQYANCRGDASHLRDLASPHREFSVPLTKRKR